MRTPDFRAIIEDAWKEFDDSKVIKTISDVSAQVSTNHVFKIDFEDRHPIFAKLSYYGKYEHFQEDHVIINNLANNLETPYENFLAKSLVKNNQVFIHKYKHDLFDAWVIFYNPIKMRGRLPRRLEESDIVKLARELALFHKACNNVKKSLPTSSKTLYTDIESLLKILDGNCQPELLKNAELIREHCNCFIENTEKIGYKCLSKIPVFVDWNIGNFSIRKSTGGFYSRWDYDWFRISNRVLDFYFFSRVVSDIGDRTVFSYVVEPLTEPRFLLFLKEYHKYYPLLPEELMFIKEAYRFFILNYVIKDGRYFFHEIYAQKLQKEAYEIYLPSIKNSLDTNIYFKELNM